MIKMLPITPEQYKVEKWESTIISQKRQQPLALYRQLEIKMKLPSKDSKIYQHPSMNVQH
jgi:hypothetical protein